MWEWHKFCQYLATKRVSCVASHVFCALLSLWLNQLCAACLMLIVVQCCWMQSCCVHVIQTWGFCLHALTNTCFMCCCMLRFTSRSPDRMFLLIPVSCCLYFVLHASCISFLWLLTLLLRHSEVFFYMEILSVFLFEQVVLFSFKEPIVTSGWWLLM